jgi:hypothetical protein
MRWRHDTSAEGTGLARFAWLVSFFATLSLVAVLALAKSAQALPVLGPASLPVVAAANPPVSVDLEDEGEEDGLLEVEECDADEECETEAEAEDEAEEDGPAAPDECLLTSAEATVFASGAQDKLRLVVRYRAVAPALVAVNYGLHGSRGSLYLGEIKQQFGKSGVFRQTEILSEAQMAKTAGARDFTVQLYALQAPRYCRHYLDRHLTVRSAAPSGLTWADPESTFRR